jgi:predicted transcriptional regulator
MSDDVRVDLARAGGALDVALQLRVRAAAALADAIRAALKAGMTEVEVARVAGTTRGTVRRAAGKL